MRHRVSRERGARFVPPHTRLSHRVLSPLSQFVGAGVWWAWAHTITQRGGAPMDVRWGMLLLGLGILSACTVLPTGPDVLVLPAVGKPMDVFQAEEASAGPMRGNSSGAPQSKPPLR